MMGGAGAKVSSSEAFVRVARDPERYAATLVAIATATQLRKEATAKANAACDVAQAKMEEAKAAVAALAVARDVHAKREANLKDYELRLVTTERQQNETAATLMQQQLALAEHVTAANAKEKSNQEAFEMQCAATQQALDAERAELLALRTALEDRAAKLAASEAAHAQLRTELSGYLARA